MKESTKSKTKSSNSLAPVTNRPSHLWRKLNRGNLRRARDEYIWPTILGLVLFESFARFFFDISLWSAALTISSLTVPLILSGSVTCLAVLLGSWSVGGASWHLLSLFWKWARLYSAGAK